jgi:hypothetical protein
MIWTRAISLTNFLVASSALGFQVFVLYPWHVELDERFDELKKEHQKLQQVVEKSMGAKLSPSTLTASAPGQSAQSNKRWWPF